MVGYNTHEFASGAAYSRSRLYVTQLGVCCDQADSNGQNQKFECLEYPDDRKRTAAIFDVLVHEG